MAGRSAVAQGRRGNGDQRRLGPEGRGPGIRGPELRVPFRRRPYGSNLYGADLSGASLRGTDLEFADLGGADLQFCGPSGRGPSGRGPLRRVHLRTPCGSDPQRSARTLYGIANLMTITPKRSPGDTSDRRVEFNIGAEGRRQETSPMAFAFRSEDLISVRNTSQRQAKMKENK